MFGKVIYYDKQAVDDYYEIAVGKPLGVGVGNESNTSTKEVKLCVAPLQAGISSTREVSRPAQESMLVNCEKLVKVLKGREDFLDMTENGDSVDLSTASRGTIVKCNCSLYVPDIFSETMILNDFKSFLLKKVGESVKDDNSAELLNTIIDNAQISKIPVEIYTDQILVCTKLSAENMLVSLQDFEDYENDELTVLLRVVNNGVFTSDQPYFDPLKDYLSLNRILRREIKNMPEGFGRICADSNYKPAEVIAIYR